MKQLLPPIPMKLSNNVLVSVLYTLIGLALSSFGYNPPSHVAIAHKVMHRAQKRILNAYDVQLMGVGEGMMECVTAISFHFDSRDTVTNNEARKMVVGCAEILLDEINRDKDIRPHLVDYPFTTKHVSITVHFSDENGMAMTYPHPCSVMAANEIVEYFYMQQPDSIGFSHTSSETYEEALAIVKGEKPEASPDFT